MSAASTALEIPGSGAADGVLKSGPLFISSKALGWKSWKKRWFILTKKSLVFFKSDPSIIVQGDGEVNLTLGSIDLNNSGSVIVREDKKLLTILFPDGQDGRGFTLKTETSEELHEWRTALENASIQAPRAAPVTLKAGIIIDDATAGPFHQYIHFGRSRVVGSPLSLALQEADGGPSFLEKALCFLEEFGTRVEGILRISADVEEVQRRIQEFEQGKTEFDASEDAHVVGDCVKHIIRELPTSIIPVCCCNELLKAYGMDKREAQIKAFRMVILKDLPTPNQLLFQRILKMMHTICCTPENQMSPSAVAACMAPLLLRPILTGECVLKDDLEFNDGNSAQLLAAAYAARTAQAIITLILEEYGYIFTDAESNLFSISVDLAKALGDEESIDAEILKKNIGSLNALNLINGGQDGNPKPPFSEELSSTSGGSDLYDNMDLSPNFNSASGTVRNSSSERHHVECKYSQSKESQYMKLENQCHSGKKMSIKSLSTRNLSPVRKSKPYSPEPHSCAANSSGLVTSSINRITSSLLERVSVKQICSMESLDLHDIEMLDVTKLEMKMNELQRRLAQEARTNESLQASLERRKHALLERRLMLQQDVEKLQEQLKAERDLRLTVETLAEQEEIAIAEADVARLKQKVAALHHQLSRQKDLYGYPSGAPYQYQHLQRAKPFQRSLRQDFDATLASVNNERMQKTNVNASFTSGISSRSNRRTVEDMESACITKNYMDESELAASTSASDSESVEVVSCKGIDNNYPNPNAPPSPGFKRNNSLGSSSIASSNLAELANRVSFYKKDESQLLKQWRSRDVRIDSTLALDAAYKSPS